MALPTFDPVPGSLAIEARGEHFPDQAALSAALPFAPRRGRTDAIRAALSATRLWSATALLLVTLSILFRLYALGRLPGINGDEAWYGVQAQHLAAGTAAWRTPSGNLPGPFQLGTLALLQAVLPPSFPLLRVPSVLASLGAMALAFAIGRRFFDGRAALVLLLLTATLPVDIVYARFGWDPSWSVFADLGASWFALAGNPWGCTLALLLALAVHPTNLFAAPFLLLCFAGAVRERDGAHVALRQGLLLAGLMLAAVACLRATSSDTHAAIRGGLVERIVDPSHLRDFALLYARLLSGNTSYAYIVGTGFGAAEAAIDAATLIVIGGLALFSVQALRGRPAGRDAAILIGWAASLAAFYLIAGNQAIGPHFERYALCLVAPSLLALATMLRLVLERRALPAAAILAALLLIGFGDRYFGGLMRSGGRSDTAFWTGAEEPKQAAFARIAAEAARHSGARIVAEDYWLYWPLAYLAAGRPLEVAQAIAPSTPPPPGGTYWVTFGGSAFDRALADGRRARLRWTIAGTARPALLHIWWTQPGIRTTPAGTAP
ncbi:MAG: hypothetical protein JOY99_04880 [Sphingomonadaceae bacterium]|nr:hypothetical protein [Sphingomonadaceae bacterium]